VPRHKLRRLFIVPSQAENMVFTLKTINNIAAIIPVAGLSSRMKDFKPLLPLGKRSILETSINLFKQNGISQILVVTGHRSKDLEDRITEMGATWIYNADFHRGMYSSIVCGVKNLHSDCNAFFLLPADIPVIRNHTIKMMLKAYMCGVGKIIYPMFDERRGHPPLISTELSRSIEDFNRTGGLRACLADFEKDAIDIGVCDRGIHMDADTPKEYEELLQKFDRINIPEYSECICLLEKSPLADEKIILHCRKVSEVAVEICTQLGFKTTAINKQLVEAAALLHDIARKEPNHAEKGAETLRNIGFFAVADIVLEHMNLQTIPQTPLSEKEIVYFADKLVVKDKLVPDFEKRYEEKLIRYKNDASAVAAIAGRLETVITVKEKISNLLQKNVMRALSL
jgi:molybdenum cofactor cytidylyltransferase